MLILKDKEMILNYIKKECLLSGAKYSEVELAIRQQLALQPVEWKQLSRQLLKSKLDLDDPDASNSLAKQQLDSFVANTIKTVNTTRNLVAYVKKESKRKSNATDLEIEIAFKRLLVLKSTEWKRLLEDSIKSNEPEVNGSPQINEQLNNFIQDTVKAVETAKIRAHERATPDRLINEYFLPTLYKEREAGAVLLGKIITQASANEEYKPYKEVLETYTDYLEAVSVLPAHLEKLIGALQKNTGKNYTPRQNAQVIAGLLDTIQKSGGGDWTTDKFLYALKLVAKVTMPDLPVDQWTLKSIEELLPVLNEIMDKSNALEKQKAALFPEDHPQLANARHAMFTSMGVEFVTLGALCQETLWKPVGNLLNAKDKLLNEAQFVSTENGLDAIHLFRTLDKVGDVINGMPSETLPQFVRTVAARYADTKEVVGTIASGVGQLANGTSHAIGVIGSAASTLTPERAKGIAGTAVTKTAKLALKAAPAVGKIVEGVTYLTPYNYSPFASTPLAFLTRKATTMTAFGWVSGFVSNLAGFVSKAPEFSREPNLVAAYLHFNEIVTTAELSVFKEEFFHSVMQKSGITDASFSDYLSFEKILDTKTLNSSLKTQLQAANKTTGEDRYYRTHLMIQRMKTLEREIKDSDNSNEVLTELVEALEYSESSTFDGDEFIKPCLERALLQYEQQQLMPQLEAALDLDRENKQLRAIYSKLKAGHLLSAENLNTLRKQSTPQTASFYLEKAVAEALKQDPSNKKLNIIHEKLKQQHALTESESRDLQLKFAHPENWFDLDEATIEIAETYGSARHYGDAEAQTPVEESRATMQWTLDKLYPVCGHILEGLNKQLNTCEELKKLCSVDSQDPLTKLCKAKIEYLQSLQNDITLFMAGIKSDDQKIAEDLRRIANGEIIGDLLSADAGSVTKQLMGLGLSTLLPKSGMLSASASGKILAYTLDRSGYLKDINTAKLAYDAALKTTPPPVELMAELSNPLQAAAFQEDAVRKAVSGALYQGQNFLESMVSYYLKSTALGLAFPPGLVFDVALGVASRASVAEKISGYLDPVTKYYNLASATVSGKISQGVDQYIAGPMATSLCSMMNIEVHKVLEQKAKAYMVAGKDRSKLNQGERDSFSGFYVQYRALKENNSTLDMDACINYLFKETLESESVTENRNVLLKQISNAFTELDKELRSTAVLEKSAGALPAAKLEDELQFLMDKIDYNNPDETQLMVMTIYNQLAMKQFAASKQVNADQAKKYNQSAMATIQLVLTRLEEADTLKASTDIRVNERAQQLAPAVKLAAKEHLESLQQALTRVSQTINKNIERRKARLAADVLADQQLEPKELGKIALAANVARSSKRRLVFQFFMGLFKLFTPIMFWGTLGLALSKGAVVAGLTLLGAGGLAGVITLAVLATLRLVVSTVKEVIARDNEFAVIKEMKASPVKKVGLNFLTGLKCFAIGMAKAIFMETVVAKIATLFTSGIKPVIDVAKSAQDSLRFNPKRTTVEAEVTTLDGLKTQLDALKTLVEAQIKDKAAVGYEPKKPDANKFKMHKNYLDSLKQHTVMEQRAAQIEAMSKEITQVLSATELALAASSNRDTRWEQGVNPELEEYKNEFSKLSEIMNQVSVIKSVEEKMQPEMSLHQSIATKSATVATEALRIAQKAALDIDEERIKFPLMQKTQNELQSMARRVRDAIDTVAEATSTVAEQAQLAKKAAADSGEMPNWPDLTSANSLATQVTPPTMAVNDKVQETLKSARSIEKASFDFLDRVEKEIASLAFEKVKNFTTQAQTKLDLAFAVSQEVNKDKEDLEFQLAHIRDYGIEDGLNKVDLIEEVLKLNTALSTIQGARIEVGELCHQAYQQINEADGVDDATKAMYHKVKKAWEDTDALENATRDLLQQFQKLGIIKFDIVPKQAGPHKVVDLTRPQLATLDNAKKIEGHLAEMRAIAERLSKGKENLDEIMSEQVNVEDLIQEFIDYDFKNVTDSVQKAKEHQKAISKTAENDPSLQISREKAQNALDVVLKDAQYIVEKIQTAKGYGKSQSYFTGPSYKIVGLDLQDESERSKFTRR